MLREYVDGLPGGRRDRVRAVFGALRWASAAVAVTVLAFVVADPDGFGVVYGADGPMDWRLVVVVAGVLAAVGCHALTVPPEPRPPMPPLVATPRLAEVTGRKTVSFAEGDCELVAVRVTHPDGPRSALLADLLTGESIAGFPVGSRWNVYCFEADNGRVVLTEAHHDVVRCGYHLHGVRTPTYCEAFQGRARPGSYLLPADLDGATADVIPVVTHPFRARRGVATTGAE
ncbi:hypothetical protein LX16_1027 [Stackebrandtia albiflava]|uniref:Uncharacterized protein n=1 Tax=Stackebrandtia albiflava TaxID=406432 RepID=A0A562VBX7_9ACTN|nr:hypothetical protein [Stackebrandtia albiflava]TWJ15327.1 hypothetical protein LX16_1027 [Stackebrandtia albiflava]